MSEPHSSPCGCKRGPAWACTSVEASLRDPAQCMAACAHTLQEAPTLAPLDANILTCRPWSYNECQAHSTPQHVPPLSPTISQGLGSRDRRDILRRTWFPKGTELAAWEARGVVVRFVVGTSVQANDPLAEAMRTEAREFGDVVEMPEVIDTYGGEERGAGRGAFGAGPAGW